MDNNGLIVLVPDETGETPSSNVKPTVDIVAVHGINGHRIKTWTCPDDGTMWLRDMLPEKIPKARIMSFGYGSHASSVISAQSIKETANELLKALQDKRGNDRKTPLIFICHSLGGSIVKELLCIANQDPDKDYFSIAVRTEYIIFFGTPHQESPSSKWEDMVFDIALASTDGEPQTRRKIMTSVIQTGPCALVDISERFSRISAQYLILSFYETKKGQIGGQEVVNEACATLDLPKEQVEGRDKDHCSISQFSHKNTDEGAIDDFKVLFNRINCKKYEEDETDEHQEEYQTYLVCRQMFSSLCPEIYFLRAPPPYPETLDWITENEDFKSWLKFPEASNLHLFGKPGSGKTVMSAWLARTLQKKRFKSRAVLFHSFNTHDDRRSSVKRLLLSFVQQLLLYGQSVINSHVKQVFEFTKKRDGSLSTVGLWLLLRSMLCFRKDSDERYQQRTDDSHSPQYTHVICIIDGIDGINDSYQIDELLREINRLRTLTDDMVVKFILTSRNDPAIRTALERIPDHFSIDIEDNSKDVRSQSIGKRLHELDGPSKELVEKTEKKLSSLDATYLQLDLILKPPQHTTICIKHQLTENNQDPESTRLEEISKLQPTELSLSSLYAQKVSQIPVEDWDQSLYVLGWLIYSIHPLSIGQLATAVAIKYGAKSLTEVAANHRITAETLQRRFGPLIIFDGQEVQLVHSTFREYVLEGELEGPDLQRLASLRDSGKIHADHARVCINYLRFEEFIPTPQPSNLVEFFDYAAQHWSTHFRNSRVEANGLNNTIAFVRDKEAAPHWFSRYWDLEYAPYGIKMTCYEIPQTVKPDTENTVVNPEYSGVEDKTDGRKYSPGESSEEDEVFSQKGGPEEGPEDGTKGGAETDGAEEPAKLMAPCYEFPLYISATLGLTPVIEKLLSDPEVPYPISDQLTALDIAALYGHLPVVKIILALHAIEYPQSGIIKALQSSCKAGHVPVVVELLANVTNQGLWGDNRPTPVDVTDEAVKEEARIVNHEAGDIEGASEGSTEVQSDVPKGTQDDIQEDTEKDAPEEPEKDAPVDSKDAPEEPKDAPEKPNDTPEEPNDTPEEPSDAQEDANDAPEDANDAPEDADDTPEDANDVSEEIKIKDHESGEQEKAIVDNMRDCHYAAARSGHTQVVRLLIERGAIVDSPGSLLPCAPLWAASYSGFADVVEELLKAGANPNFFESDRLTPLQISAFRGHTEVVRVLLSNHNPRHHVDVDMVNFGCAPIHLAAEYGHTYVVRELLQNKATIDLITEISPSTAMHLASGGGHLGVLRLLLDRQADMEAKDETGNTPLHIASQYGHSTAVDLLIEQGADVEATSDGRVTPLMCASCYGYSAIVIKLLNSGTSIDATTKEDKFSAFYYACVNGHEKIMDIFIRNGVDVDKTDVYNQTPLNSACLLNMVGSVKKLLEHGADVFHSYDDGRTVLYDAVLSKNVEIVKVVIEAMLTRSGDTKLQTELSGYPLNKAIYFEVEDIIRLLLDNGANVAYVTSTGETLFSQKWTAESETSFQLLLDHANSEAISVLDKWGRSPLFLAAAYHYENATKFLLDRGADKNQVDIFGRRPIDITSKPEVMQLLTGKLAKKLTCRWMYPRINCNLWIKCDECQLSTADAENDKPFFFYHCCTCSDDNWDICSGCYDSGIRCPRDHDLNIFFVGGGIRSFSQNCPWVSERRLPEVQELEPAASKTAVPVGDSDRDEQELEPAASKTATLEVPVGGNDSESDDE